MRSVKKQTTALTLLMLTALPLFFAAGIFIKQTVLQQQIRQRFETETLQTINISATDIVWVKPGKEILNNGKLFDVKSFKTLGIIVELTGFYDHKEDKLVNQIKRLIEKKEDSSNPVNQLVVKFLFYPKNSELNIFSIQNNWEIVKHQFPVYSEVITSLVYPAPVPPPKFC